MGEQKGQSHSALRIVAACQSTAEFVAAYARYCEGRTLFIATKSPKPAGQIVKFKIGLASGEHLMTGVGPVVEIFADRENRFGRPGMRVEVEKLDASGRRWMEKLRDRSSATPAPAVVSASTGMFATVSDESTAAQAAAPSAAAVEAAPPAPAEPAPPVLPVAAPEEPSAAPVAVPIAVADNLSAGWEVDDLPVMLARPRATNGEKATASRKPEKNGERPAADKNGEPLGDRAQAAVAVSGELDMPAPLPPPPATPAKGRSKRITFPALMFNKPRGLGVPAPSGQVVPKPLALLPPASPREAGKLRPPSEPGKLRPASEPGKLRPPTEPGPPPPPPPSEPSKRRAGTAPIARVAEPPHPVERDPAAPVAPLGTPADTEPHAMVPPELESSFARPLEAADGTPPPAAEVLAPPAPADRHPELADAPPESSDVVTSAPEAAARPRRAKVSTTTPPPIWAERTVTQTLAVLVGGRPDPGVREETVHWTNPGFSALKRPEPPQVDIVEEESPAAGAAAVPVVVGVELSSGLDRTVVSPPPVGTGLRLRLVAALVVTAAAGVGAGYLLGLRHGAIEKMPVDEVASGPAAAPALIAACSDQTAITAATAPISDDEEGPAETAPPDDESPRPAEVAAERAVGRARPREPAAQPCYVNAMTSPAGATVLVDGRVAGRTPLRSKIACGRHSVRFEMQSYQAATRTFSVRRGETEKVSAELSRPRTVLRVESTPAGASVLVDGSSVGVTPLTTTVPGFVTTSVTLSKPGYRPVTRQISPTSSSARIGATLKADSSPAARRSVSRRR